MGKPKRVALDWEENTGRDRGHSSRLIRVQQLAGLSPVGVQGKAADFPDWALVNFAVGDTTGDNLAEAAERTLLWTGLVRDRSVPPTRPVMREADQAFHAWKQQADSDVTDLGPTDDILPGATLGAGLAALLHPMADASPNISFQGGHVPFTQIVSHLRFRCEFIIGGSEGPLVIVRCGSRDNRYISTVPPSDKIRNARCPVETHITIDTRHLAILARLLADTKANTAEMQPVPPSAPAKKASAKSKNAGLLPGKPTFLSNLSNQPGANTAGGVCADASLICSTGQISKGKLPSMHSRLVTSP